MWYTKQTALGGPIGGDIQGEHTDPQRKHKHRTEVAQQSPPYLILSEEDQPGHQDIDNIAQTRVLEKFGNLTSKKQEKTSLKNELTGWVTVQLVGELASAGHLVEGDRAASSAWAAGSEHHFFRKQKCVWDSTLPLGLQSLLNHVQTSVPPSGEIQAVKLTSHSTWSLPGAQVGKPTVLALHSHEDEALLTAHQQGMTQHLSEICHHMMGILEQMKQLETVLF